MPAAHAAPVFRSRMAPATGFRSSPRPFIGSTRAYPAAPLQLRRPALRYPIIAPPPAPRFYQKNNTYRSGRRVRRFGIIAYPSSVIGFLPDTGFYDNSWNDLSYPSGPTALQQPDYGPAEYPAYSPYPDYGAEYAQYPQPGRPPAVDEVPSTSANPETVTLVFNNGQPPEQIQNYLATPATITVIDGTRHRDIPVAELDIPATIKANRAAGIDFSLPTTTR